MEQWTDLKLGKEYFKVVYCHPNYLKVYVEYIMWNIRLHEVQLAVRRNIKPQIVDDTTLMAESEEEVKILLMKVKEKSDKADLKFNIQKTKIVASSPITSWQIDGETMETVTDFLVLGSKITVDDDWSYEFKRLLPFGRKVQPT